MRCIHKSDWHSPLVCFDSENLQNEICEENTDDRRAGSRLRRLVLSIANYDDWQKPHLENVKPDTSAPAHALREKRQETEVIEELVQKYNETGIALSAEEAGFVEGRNSLAKAYFSKNYGVDISEKIATLTVRKVIYLCGSQRKVLAYDRLLPRLVPGGLLRLLCKGAGRQTLCRLPVQRSVRLL